MSVADQRLARARIVRAVLDELRDDPGALDELRSLLGAGPAVYSPRTLAAELGVTPRAIRAAIERGDLEARRSGRGYVIGRESVAEWTRTSGRPRRPRRPAARESRMLRNAIADGN
jgi:excisionase family DNA binding protein